MKVIYKGEATAEQIGYRAYDDPRGLLIPGKAYVVKLWDEYNWHTDVYLKDVQGRFNSVFFCVIEED